MPIYEYGCEKCKRKTEAIQQVGEKRLRICPHCGGKLKKLASAPAIQFKGSGWYVTDYAKSSSSGSSDSGSSDSDSSAKLVDKDSGSKDSKDSSSKSDSSSDSKSESKSQSKSDSKSESRSESKSESKSGSKRSDKKKS
jgi:putative FmdB family regulatory protein